MPDPFMRHAIQLAIENISSGKGGPFGAVIVRDGAALASGTNLVTSSNDPTAHAEVVAIRNACAALGRFDLSGCELYTTCEPCPMCLGAIYWARISKAWYGASRSDAASAGFDDALIYSEIGVAPAARKVPMAEMMRAEAMECFRAWERAPDRIAY